MKKITITNTWTNKGKPIFFTLLKVFIFVFFLTEAGACFIQFANVV